MPKGIYDHSKYPNMGFQKGHKDFVTIRKGHLAWNKGLTKKLMRELENMQKI